MSISLRLGLLGFSWCFQWIYQRGRGWQSRLQFSLRHFHVKFWIPSRYCICDSTTLLLRLWPARRTLGSNTNLVTPQKFEYHELTFGYRSISDDRKTASIRDIDPLFASIPLQKAILLRKSALLGNGRRQALKQFCWVLAGDVREPEIVENCRGQLGSEIQCPVQLELDDLESSTY